MAVFGAEGSNFTLNHESFIMCFSEAEVSQMIREARQN